MLARMGRVSVAGTGRGFAGGPFVVGAGRGFAGGPFVVGTGRGFAGGPFVVGTGRGFAGGSSSISQICDQFRLIAEPLRVVTS